MCEYVCWLVFVCVCVRVCARVCLVCHYINSHKHNALKIGAKLANYSEGKEELKMRGEETKRGGEGEKGRARASRGDPARSRCWHWNWVIEITSLCAMRGALMSCRCACDATDACVPRAPVPLLLAPCSALTKLIEICNKRQRRSKGDMQRHEGGRTDSKRAEK